MTQHVRIYGGKESTVVGFDSNIVAAGIDEEIIDFFDDRGYDYGPAKPPLNGDSLKYLEVMPPITAEHFKELGALSLNGYQQELI